MTEQEKRRCRYVLNNVVFGGEEMRKTFLNYNLETIVVAIVNNGFVRPNMNDALDRAFRE